VTDAPTWFLEYYDGDSSRAVRVPLAHVPFRIGRKSGLDLTLASNEISSEHAEIASDGGRLLLKDLGSRNGTFLRDCSVECPVPLAAGDVFHLGPIALRLGHTAEQRAPTGSYRLAADAASPNNGKEQLSAAFGAMLEMEAVEPVFQPIIELATGTTVALEALGRGRSPDLPKNPVALFRIAETSGETRQLARMFRQTALAAAHWARTRLPIFLNVHSSELAAADFFDEIAAMRSRHPKIRLVLEVSEQFATPLPRLRALRTFLASQEIGLSYDDFGAGLARIHELAEAPADYLKFDASGLRGLATAEEPERRRVSALVAAARALGMRLLAEGLESAEEANACRQMGFELGQGFHFGRPAALTVPSRG
jgi:EAL domain-containing protein (putative c-di-GMP-specific phosphodiesterase class I)